MTEKLRVAGSLATALAVLALVAGCAGGPITQRAYISPAYEPDILNYAASKGGLLTEVIGNPFASPKSELDAAVIETAARSHFGQKVPFITQAPAGYTSPYRVVFAMNPVPGTGDYDLCSGKVKTRARQPAESDRVDAALCAREDVITSVKGRVAGPTGPRDPAFLHLISQLTLALLPPESPERRNDDDEPFFIF